MSYVLIAAETKTQGDFFPYVLELVGGDRYSAELVKVHESWPRHHGYLKKVKNVKVIIQNRAPLFKKYRTKQLKT